MLLAAATLFAQYRSKRPPPHALRALGVLEWPATGKSVPRLVPLVILAEGKYYDAGIYLASPVPLAVQPGTVYEGQQSGVPKGLFTINVAQEMTEKKIWSGAGNWAEGATGTYAAAPREEDRPILRRARPEDSGAPASSGPATPAPQAPTEKQVESDPNRPVLQKGKPPVPPPAPPTPPATKPVASTPPPPAPAAASPAAPKWMVAVSDAQPGEGHSFVLSWSPSEKEALTRKAVALAQEEIAKYPIAPGGTRAVPGPLTDIEAHFFDIYTDNSPEIVMSARLPAGSYTAPATRSPRKGAGKAATRSQGPQAQPDIYITLVARGDLDGNLRRIFVSITDPSRLDSTPRLQLIDAVDADGRGLGQLLFHKIGARDTGLEGNVVLYRVDPDQLTELFDSWVQ